MSYVNLQLTVPLKLFNGKFYQGGRALDKKACNRKKKKRKNDNNKRNNNYLLVWNLWAHADGSYSPLWPDLSMANLHVQYDAGPGLFACNHNGQRNGSIGNSVGPNVTVQVASLSALWLIPSCLWNSVCCWIQVRAGGVHFTWSTWGCTWCELTQGLDSYYIMGHCYRAIHRPHITSEDNNDYRQNFVLEFGGLMLHY